LNEIDKWCNIGSHLLSFKPNMELENTNFNHKSISGSLEQEWGREKTLMKE
jgi:hypothetical protein